MEVSDLITLYRKQAGMTLDELAERSGVSKGALTKIIGGVTKAPTLDNMKAIARALGKTLADFDDLPIPTNKTPGPNGPGEEEKQGFISLVSQLSDENKAVLSTVIRALLALEQGQPDGSPGKAGKT